MERWVDVHSESSCGLWLALGVLTNTTPAQTSVKTSYTLRLWQQELKSYSVSVIKVNIAVASESAALLILQCDIGLNEKKRKSCPCA